MNNTVYKIAIAGFLHDIGKFAERAKIEMPSQYANDNEQLYQPYYKIQNRFTHKHALYTAYVLDEYVKIKKHLPKGLFSENDTTETSFINLAAMHHKPESSLQWIIAIADRLSSGIDRDEFEDYSFEINVKDYTKTRLLTLFQLHVRWVWH